MTQVAAIIKTSELFFTMRHMNVQMQYGTSDCGLFAVAFATLLCARKDPMEYHLDQERMRTHLKLCYEKGKMTLFPICGKLRRHTNAIKCTKEVEIHCICRLPRTKELTLYGNMAQCGCCRKWFHQQFAAIPQKAFTHKV